MARLVLAIRAYCKVSENSLPWLENRMYAAPGGFSSLREGEPVHNPFKVESPGSPLVPGKEGVPVYLKVAVISGMASSHCRARAWLLSMGYSSPPGLYTDQFRL